MPVYLLIDNGSKQPQATLCLREVADKLSASTGKTVHPVSLQHADSIKAEQLEGIAANTFYSFLYEYLEKGEKDFVVIPMFFGMSGALTSFVPEQVSLLEKEFGKFNLKLADVVFPLPEGEARLAEILHDNIKTSVKGTLADKKIVVVDHGSPAPKITEVRKQVTSLLRSLLDGVTIDEAVMEKRAGKQYEFNGALLKDYLIEQAQQGHNEIIIAMLFFLPGRHAGECGDIEEICDSVCREYPALKTAITPLISEHELLVSILHDRLLAAEES